jgi:hypothetical protein
MPFTDEARIALKESSSLNNNLSILSPIFDILLENGRREKLFYSD